MEPQPELPRPYRRGEPPPVRDTSDQRRWVVSKDTNPRIRMAYEPEAAQAFVAGNPGWSAIAEDDPRWLPYRPGFGRPAPAVDSGTLHHGDPSVRSTRLRRPRSSSTSQ